MYYSDEGMPSRSRPSSIEEDTFINNLLQNATIDMSEVGILGAGGIKKVRFKDTNEVFLITSPNANTEYAICDRNGATLCLQRGDLSSFASSSQESPMAKREYTICDQNGATLCLQRGDVSSCASISSKNISLSPRAPLCSPENTDDNSFKSEIFVTKRDKKEVADEFRKT